MTKVIVTMPAFNEADGILEFLEELNQSLLGYQTKFIVVDDCSKDQTSDLIKTLNPKKFNVSVYTNPTNLGHGLSTLRALNLGIKSTCDHILSIDGDGQFLGKEIKNLLESHLLFEADITEGVRIRAGEPSFRKIVTKFTKFLVTFRTGAAINDANTPLRIYRKEALESLLKFIPEKSKIPNMHISVASRKLKYRILEKQVTSISPRRKLNPSGSWKSRFKNIPSKNFILFCFSALFEWLTANFNFKSHSNH